MHTTPSQRQSPMYALPRRKRRRWPWMVALAVAGGLVVLIVVASLAGGKPTPSGSSAQQPSTSTPAITSRIPSPDTGQRADYLVAAGALNPGLVVNEDRAIRHARSICDRILHPSGGTAGLVRYTVAELSGGDATINTAQARQVIRAVKMWCPAA
ncbi:hypothetical protein J5X84_07655 [Streptosporangiaceae bacterium NEAU-GS5]|nr:hypothetical protein [Streptosporangiaceae bacterium NEAU-GS5]